MGTDKHGCRDCKWAEWYAASMVAYGEAGALGYCTAPYSVPSCLTVKRDDITNDMGESCPYWEVSEDR